MLSFSSKSVYESKYDLPGFSFRAKLQPVTSSLRVKRRAKCVRFADENGATLCFVHEYELPAKSETSCFSSSVLRGISSRQVVFNEAHLNADNVAMVAFGLVHHQSVYGAVAVRNLSYEKSVVVRLSYDEWKSYEDVEGKFIQQEDGGKVDRFFFYADFKEKKDLVESIALAVKYVVNGNEYWDNNDGKNYSILL